MLETESHLSRVPGFHKKEALRPLDYFASLVQQASELFIIDPKSWIGSLLFSGLSPSPFRFGLQIPAIRAGTGILFRIRLRKKPVETFGQGVRLQKQEASNLEGRELTRHFKQTKL